MFTRSLIGFTSEGDGDATIGKEDGHGDDSS